MKRIFEREERVLSLGSIFFDIAILFLSDLAAFRLYLGEHFVYSPNFMDYQKGIFYIILFKLLCLYIFQCYSRFRFKSSFVVIISILKAAISGALVMGLIAYSFRIDAIPRMVIVLSWFFGVVALCAWRTIFKQFFAIFLGKDFFKLHILIIGTSRTAEEMAIWLLNNGIISYKVVGFVSDRPTEPRRQIMGYPVIASLDNIAQIPYKYRIDQVFVLTPGIKSDDLSRVFGAFKRKREVTFCTAPELCEDAVLTDHFVEGRIQFIPAVPFQRVPIWYPPLKRVLDIFVTLVLFAALSPLMLILALLIKISSPGPVFYVTRRVGLMGKEFVMFKFRSMYHISSQRRVERWTKKADSRIMPVGKFMRRYRLDELPQLINVIRNDMSLIGPRPETRHYVMHLSKRITLYSERLNAKPGITGWAQVNFGYAGTIEENREKLIFDIFYIQNQSVFLDFLIALKTIKTVISGVGL